MSRSAGRLDPCGRLHGADTAWERHLARREAQLAQIGRDSPPDELAPQLARLADLDRPLLPDASRADRLARAHLKVLSSAVGELPLSESVGMALLADKLAEPNPELLRPASCPMADNLRAAVATQATSGLARDLANLPLTHRVNERAARLSGRQLAECGERMVLAGLQELLVLTEQLARVRSPELAAQLLQGLLAGLGGYSEHSPADTRLAVYWVRRGRWLG